MLIGPYFFQGARGPDGSVGEKVKKENEKLWPVPPFSLDLV